MNFKLTAILAALLILIAGVMFYLSGRPAKVADAEPATAVFKPKPGSIRDIKLVRDGQTVVAFSRASGKWLLTEPVSAPAEAWQLESIADGLTALTYKEKFTPDAARPLDKIGLAPAKTVLSFTDAAGKSVTLDIGKRTPAKTIYAKLSGDNTAYELDEEFFEKIDKDPSEFRSRDLVDITPADVQHMIVKHQDQTVELGKTDGKWVITKPITTRANQSVVESLISEVRNARVQNFSEIKKSSLATGLSAPQVAITLTVADAATPATQPAGSQPATRPTHDVTMQFGNFTDLTHKLMYVSLASANEAYILNGEIFGKVNKQLFDLRDPAVTPAAVNDATTINSGEVMLKKENNQWQMTIGKSAPVPADSAAIENVLTAIKNLRANQYLDGAGDLKSLGLEPATQKITLTLPGQTQEEVLLIGEPQKEQSLTPIKRQGEPTVYLVQSADVAKMAIDPLSLRDKSVAKIPADTIRSITISGGARLAPLTLTKDGAKWIVQEENRKAAADEAKISALLADLDPISAEKFIGTHASAIDKAMIVTILHDDTAAPTTQIAGPMPTKTITTVLSLTHKKDGWQANVNGQWVFTPAAGLVEKLTKETFVAPATQPATAPK